MRHLLELMGINDILHVLNVQTVSQVGSSLEFNHVPTQSSSPPVRNSHHRRAWQHLWSWLVFSTGTKGTLLSQVPNPGWQPPPLVPPWRSRLGIRDNRGFLTGTNHLFCCSDRFSNRWSVIRDGSICSTAKPRLCWTLSITDRPLGGYTSPGLLIDMVYFSHHFHTRW